LVVDTEEGPQLIVNVYMPTNYGDSDSLEIYVDCLSKLHALIIGTNVVCLSVCCYFWFTGCYGPCCLK